MEMIGTEARPLVIGTRASKLALTQSNLVAAELRERGLYVEVRTFTTEGDVNRASLSRLGGVGVFAAQLRVALLEGDCDLAVHSMKDLPTVPVPGLMVAAVPIRVNPSDALVARDGLRLSELPSGARIGTGSPRRTAQLLAIRPDLECVDIRGNVGTRLGRVRGIVDRAAKTDLSLNLPEGKPATQDLDAVVLALSGLIRLRLDELATEDLSRIILPAAAQGALALETRDDLPTNPAYKVVWQILRIVDDLPSRLEVTAERSLMRYLEAGCAAPLGVRGSLNWDNAAGAEAPSGKLELTARVVTPGEAAQLGQTIEVSAETTVLLGADKAERDFALTAAEQLGVDLARELLEAGGGERVNLQADLTDLLVKSKKNPQIDSVAEEKLRWGEL